MPRLKPDTIQARKEHILDAAEICFARAGFHRTTMQEIASQAKISLGAIYVYFDAKESLIEGLAERDRLMLSDDLAAFAQEPDLIEGLRKLGDIYAVQRPRHKQILHVEIGAESTRNEEIGRIFRSVDNVCRTGFETVLAQAAQNGRIDPSIDPRIIAQIMIIIGDGMFWRSAVDPDFKAQDVLPALSAMIAALINPSSAISADPENPGTADRPGASPASTPKRPSTGRPSARTFPAASSDPSVCETKP